uniref:Aldehyde dehydrogenase 16 family, member A1 n=1 Tax=Cyclopterus lumpus TaxID=8103 RepID=A0A8C3A7D6_CYCLU
MCCHNVLEYDDDNRLTLSPLHQAWLDNHSRSLGLFVDGKCIRPADRQSRSLADSKGGNLCSTVCAVEDDVSQCASSAVKGHKAWGDLSCHQRAKVLLRSASALGQHGTCVSELCELCEVSCSPSSLIRLLQYYSSWAQLRDALVPDWTPLGVLSSDLFLLGNSVIVVPGRSRAPPTLLLAQLFTGAGLPAGALNVLTGSDMSLCARVAQNANIGYVAYSGNKQDGVLLCKSTAGMGIPVSVSPNIGARCPFIIFESADIDSAVDAVIEAAFKKKREVHWVLCVQESVVDSVVARLGLRMAGMKCVALHSDGDRGLVDAAVRDAQQQGATLIQSCAAPSSGAQYPPTVLCGAAPSSPFVVNPSPGPLLPLMTFRSNTEAVVLGNHSPHGQAASIWTEDLTLALETAKSLSVGSVWVNSHSVSDPCLPVSGHKDSGTCTDGGQEVCTTICDFFTSPRSIPVSTPVLVFLPSSSLLPSYMLPPSSPISAPKVYLQFVGGKPCKSVSGCSVAVQSPGGASVLAYCPDGGRKDVRNAVEAAVKVQPSWMKKSPSARAQSLYSLSKGLEAKRRDIAGSINVQTGLSMDEADKEVELSIARLSDWAAYCDKVQGGSPALPQSGSALSLPGALGVVGVVLPDESPLLSMVTLLGAAIGNGNAVVMVPSEKYPLPALALIQVLQSSDLPAGLVNIITGSRDQLTVALATHSVIKAIWYWGSAEGCQYLQYTCTSPLKTLRLSCQKEDGGKDWTWSHPSLLEEMWRSAVQWKSVWIPTA